MKYFFIVNPKAGKINPMETIIPNITIILDKNNIDYQIFETNYQRHAIKLTKDIINSTTSKIRIIGVGGDGTLNEIIQSSVNQPHVEICIIPAGTGNDFVKSFGSQDYFNIENIILGKAIKIDTINYNDNYSINICSVGLDAKVGSNISTLKNIPFLKGKTLYNLSTIIELSKKLGDKLELIIDDKTLISNTFLFAVICNGQYYGGSFNPAPHAYLNDGLLDLILIKVPKYINLPTLIKEYKNGTYLYSKTGKEVIKTFKCKKIEIKSIKKATCNLDGEIYSDTNFIFKINEKSLNFIIPNKAKTYSII